LQTEEMCIIAVSQPNSVENLSYVCNQTAKICLTAVKKCCTSIKYVNPEFLYLFENNE
jgi:hypothetical protein